MKVKNIAPVLTIFVLMLVFSGCPSGKMDPVPQPLNFGNVYVGTTQSATGLWNNGGNIPCTINGIAVDSAPTFTSASMPNEVVAVGADSSPFTFVFAPASAGTANGEAQIFTAGVRPKKMRLTGVGVFQKDGTTLLLRDGDLTQGESLDFKEAPVNTSKTKTFKIKNSDAANPVTVRASSRSGGNIFAVTNPAGNITVPAGGEIALTVTFTPAAVKDYSDILEFTDINNAANVAGTIVKGKGTQG